MPNVASRSVILLSGRERKEVVSIAGKSTSAQRDVLRANIVLLVSDDLAETVLQFYTKYLTLVHFHTSNFPSLS